MKKLILVFYIAIGICGCKEVAESDKSLNVAYDRVGSYADASEAVDTVAAVAVEEMSVSLPSKEEAIEPKIIKNADLRYQTDDLENTFLQIQNAVKKYNALVQNDSQNKEYREISRSLTVRIPSKNFDAFIKDISAGVNYFDRKEISSNDVTEEYIDVESRVKTKKILENRYLELLKKANKISEMLEIEKQLSEIREEIEAKEGRLKYLQNQVSMSTVHINFYKTLANENQVTASYGNKIINALKSGFNSISSFFIWLLEIWPVIVILPLLFIIIKRWFKRKFKK